MAASKKKPPRPEGRPTLYHPEEHPRVARKVMGEGKTLGQLAEVLGVHRSTMDEWRINHPEFSAMIELGREDALDHVEASLHQRAVGYQHPSEKIVVVSGGQGEGSHVERVDITVQYPPDPAAAMHILKNKRPKDWKDKQVIEHQGLAGLAQRLARGVERERVKRKPEGTGQ